MGLSVCLMQHQAESVSGDCTYIGTMLLSLCISLEQKTVSEMLFGACKKTFKGTSPILTVILRVPTGPCVLNF